MINKLNGKAKELAQYGLAGVCIALILLIGFMLWNFQQIANNLGEKFDANNNAINALNTNLKNIVDVTIKTLEANQKLTDYIILKGGG